MASVSGGKVDQEYEPEFPRVKYALCDLQRCGAEKRTRRGVGEVELQFGAQISTLL